MIVTKEIILAGKSRNGGWALAQLQVFGYDHYKEVWTREVVGKEFSEEKVAQFLRLKDAHLKKLPTSNQVNLFDFNV